MSEELLDGSRWFHIALVVWVAIAASRPLRPATRERTLRLLHLAYGSLVAVLATGHIVGVTIASQTGRLQTSTPPWALYGIGLVYLLPGLAIAGLAWRSRAELPVRRLLLADGFLVLAFIAVIESSALAVPAILNIVALRSQRPKPIRAVVVATCVAYAGMLVASFLLDGP